uniref:CS domain-containing protein n=1 Tax=Rhizophora mucronata TaxID=61149 RepID=A0A2P2LL48_RHIMU
MAEKLAPDKRHSFINNGQEVFEWDQTLEEVNIYINLPPNVHSKQFYCKIQSKHVEVGIKGNPPYLNHELTCPVKTDSSFWTLGIFCFSFLFVCFFLFVSPFSLDS